MGPGSPSVSSLRKRGLVLDHLLGMIGPVLDHLLGISIGVSIGFERRCFLVHRSLVFERLKREQPQGHWVQCILYRSVFCRA